MCWSFEWSLLIGCVSWLVAMVLIWRNRGRDRSNALFLVSYSAMQFVDSALWYDEASHGLERCSRSNRVMSSVLIPAILFVQLIVSDVTSAVHLSPWWHCLVGVAGLRVFMKFWRSCTVLSNDNHHLWWGEIRFTFLDVLFFDLLLFRPRTNVTSFRAWISTPSSWLPLGVLWYLKHLQPHVFGSYWCFLANAFSLRYLFVST